MWEVRYCMRHKYLTHYLIQTGNEDIFTTCPILSLLLTPHKEVESCVGSVR